MSRERPRLYLSPPDCGADEIGALARAVQSGWVAPLGPEVDQFEQELASVSDRGEAVALSSGTAAIHLGLLALGVGPGTDVVVPTLTFGATAFAVMYTGATPVFLDSESASWNLDPVVLGEFLRDRAREGRLPAAVVTVDVFGRTCDYDALLSVCAEYEIPVLADSAEALGATHGTRPAGSLGAVAVYSFNGNKIITTSGGGVLLTDDAEIARKARHWSTQSREPAPWYQHEEIGYNYRMSNLLAALGRVQLGRLPAIVERRRQIRGQYAELLESRVGVAVPGDPPWGRANGWLTTVLFDGGVHPGASERVRLALERENIESRPVWKPMHQQPIFVDAERHLTGVADKVFREGLCLPSGSALSDGDVARVAALVLNSLAP